MIRPVSTHSAPQIHLLAILTRLLSGFAHARLTTSISDSIVGDTRESIFSRSFWHMLEPFWMIFSGHGSVHLMHKWCTCVLSSQQEMIWCKCCQVFRVVTYCSLGSCAECLLYKKHFDAEYLVGEAFFVRDCNHDFLETLNKSLQGCTKMWSSRRIEFPNNLFGC